MRMLSVKQAEDPNTVLEDCAPCRSPTFSQGSLWISKSTTPGKWSWEGERDRHFRGEEVSEGNRTHVTWKRLLGVAGGREECRKRGRKRSNENKLCLNMPS